MQLYCKKECLKISKLTKFSKRWYIEGERRYYSKKGQVSKFYRCFNGGGTDLTPTIQTYVKYGDFAELLYIVVSFQQITFKVGIFPNFKAFLLTVLTDFC